MTKDLSPTEKTCGIDHYIEQFREQLTSAARNYIAAATAFTAALDQFPDAKAKFREACPDLPNTFWKRLEEVGRKQLDSRLLYCSYAAERYLRRLPYSEQKRVLDTGVEVYVHSNDHLLVQVDRLTPQQCKMVFGADGLRDLAGQKAYLESEITFNPGVKNHQPDYEVKRDTMIVNNAPFRLSRRDIIDILNKMEGR
jgi:hypothetical protein